MKAVDYPSGAMFLLEATQLGLFVSILLLAPQKGQTLLALLFSQFAQKNLPQAVQCFQLLPLEWHFGHEAIIISLLLKLYIVSLFFQFCQWLLFSPHNSQYL